MPSLPSFLWDITCVCVCVCVCVNIILFIPKCLYPRVQLTGHRIIILKKKKQNYQAVFQNGCIFKPTKYERARLSASLSGFGIVIIFYFSHSFWYIVLAHHSLHFHLPDGWWCWTFFLVLICHLYIIFGEMFVNVIYLFSNQIAYFFTWILRALYMF